MSKRRKKYRKRRKPGPNDDSQALRGAVLAVVDAMGQGGLTWFATELGITPSNLRKRLTTALNGFDSPTMRATLIMAENRAPDDHPGECVTSGAYEIFNTTDEQGNRRPLWRPKAH